MTDFKQSKILLIFSEEIVTDETIRALNTRINTGSLKMDYVVNPSRSTLETMISENYYFFVIPFVQYIKSNGRTFNLIHFLDSLDIKYYGCDYIKCLMVNDTYTFLKNVGVGIPTKIVTRYYTPSFENDFFPARIVLEESAKKYSLSFNPNQLKELIDEIFKNNKSIEELAVQKAVEYDQKIFYSDPKSHDISSDVSPMPIEELDNNHVATICACRLLDLLEMN